MKSALLSRKCSDDRALQRANLTRKSQVTPSSPILVRNLSATWTLRVCPARETPSHTARWRAVISACIYRFFDRAGALQRRHIHVLKFRW